MTLVHLLKSLAIIVIAVEPLLCVTSLFAQESTTGRRRSVRQPVFQQTPRPVTVHDDFRFGDHGWTPGFADYSPLGTGYELASGLRPLPPELGIDGTGMMITGHNRSDDLFMFLTKRLGPEDGIEPEQHYSATLAIMFGSNVGRNCTGIGGSPGESVYLKAGATGEEPRVVLDESDNHYRLTVDKGNQAVGGPAATVAGNIVNETLNCSGDAPFFTVSRAHEHTYTAKADSSGSLWLLVGTDSAFEGKTTLYYQSISVTLVPIDAR